MVREDDTLSVGKTDEETIPEDVWVAGAEERMCPVRGSLVTDN